MTPAEFKKKWAKVNAKESAAYQSHFDDLCRMLGVPPPLEADPKGEFFCFQRRVVKDAEFFPTSGSGEEAEPSERGFADVWKRGAFAWEYKGKKKNLDDAYRQLLRYRESLENPPLLVVCDFDRFIVRTNYNGTVQETHEFTNATIDHPESLRVLRALFKDPDALKPLKTTAQVTEQLAGQIAEVAKSLQKREAGELVDAKTRAQMNFAQRKNLRIARFLNRVVFCFFAEDTGLLPGNLFSEITKAGLADAKHLAQTLETLFAVMAKGGPFGKDKIRYFNGHLFEDSTVFELTEDELRKLAEASEADWQFIEPSIMGTLFERALEPEQRSQLGAHYTSETDILTLVEPVLMAPLRREWAALKGELVPALKKGTTAQRDKLAAFQKRLATVSVLDPACGSGNFLYVSLRLLLDLEKEVVTQATQLGFKLTPLVSVQQLRAIEINPYAFELAQVSVQIGFLQWRRDNGFDNDRTPVLQNLDGFQNKDALVREVFKRQPKDLKEAQAEEHTQDSSTKGYVEREWPVCDVIVGNPPFLGDKFMRRELGDNYVGELRRIYGNRIPGQSDLCCYWFEKAREQIEKSKCRRAGLLATQGIRGGANREVLNRIKDTGDIFFAQSDRPWILAGANVHVSMVGFDGGEDTARVFDGKEVDGISAQLTTSSDLASVQRLAANEGHCFISVSMHGNFELTTEKALEFLQTPNPSGLPSSDVVRLWSNGLTIVQRQGEQWLVDFPPDLSLEQAARYAGPFGYVEANVKPERDKNHRATYRKFWWRHGEARIALRKGLARVTRYLATPRIAKHRVFVRLSTNILPTDQVVSVTDESDEIFGVLQSRFHELWALNLGTRLETRPRYTPTTCFETFPFPFPFTDDLRLSTPVELPANPQKPSGADRAYAENLAAKNYFMAKEEPPPYRSAPRTPDEHRATVAAAAKELNELRERWLNPPEWTETRTLEFPGSVSGPWARYVDPATVDAKTGIGMVRYPRLEPRNDEFAAKLKKRTLTNLYNERPTWLALAHKKLDAAVAAAYGWPADLSDEAILEKLLALNLERAAAEAKDAKPTKKAQRGKAGDEML